MNQTYYNDEDKIYLSIVKSLQTSSNTIINDEIIFQNIFDKQTFAQGARYALGLSDIPFSLSDAMYPKSYNDGIRFALGLWYNKYRLSNIYHLMYNSVKYTFILL